MRPDFRCDPAARHGSEDFLQCLRIRPHSLLQSYLPGFIHHAVPTVAIAQIESDCQFLLRNIPAPRCCSGANLLHCPSHFYLCLEHVDNLGAYIASRPETGLLIPFVAVRKLTCFGIYLSSRWALLGFLPCSVFSTRNFTLNM